MMVRGLPDDSESDRGALESERDHVFVCEDVVGGETHSIDESAVGAAGITQDVVFASEENRRVVT
jgi:hypothetical protein